MERDRGAGSHSRRGVLRRGCIFRSMLLILSDQGSQDLGTICFVFPSKDPRPMVEKSLFHVIPSRTYFVSGNYDKSRTYHPPLIFLINNRNRFKIVLSSTVFILLLNSVRANCLKSLIIMLIHSFMAFPKIPNLRVSRLLAKSACQDFKLD